MSVENAEEVLADLRAKRARLVARGVEIGHQRAAIAYDAHASGDAKAEKRLAELHREAAEAQELRKACTRTLRKTSDSSCTAGAVHTWANSGHRGGGEGCPLLGVKRTSKIKSVTSAFDPKETSAAQIFYRAP